MQTPETETAAAPVTPSSLTGLTWRILIPVMLGISVVAWLFHREFQPELLTSLRLTPEMTLFLLLAFLLMCGRIGGLTWRFRTLTDRRLTWGSALRVDLLCEFTSCITPSAVGGSSMSMFFLNGEGISIGRATTLTITTLFLDELFFVVSMPIVMTLIPYHTLFDFGSGSLSFWLQSAFWTVYGLLVAWTVLLFLGILVRPQTIHRLLNSLFRLRWLRRWSARADRLGAEMEATGRDLKQRKIGWWIEAFAATALSWTCRYLVVNALFMAFAPGAPQLVVFARQYVVWVCLMVSPTPGSAGISEWLFTTYYGDLIPGGAGIALVIALFWRVLSYYTYLIAGACIIPSWLRRGYRRLRMSPQ